MQQPSEYPQNPQAYYGQQSPPYMQQQQQPSEYPQNSQPQYGQQPPPYMSQQQYSQPFQPQYPPQQLSYMPYPPQVSPLYQPQPQMNVTVNVNQRGPNFLIRVLWYLFIGWWVGGIWLAFGYFCFLTGIGIPLGLVVLNRLPRVLTLRPVSQHTSVMVSNGNVTVNINGAQQVNFLVRVVYFLCLGWWLGGIWAAIGYGLCLTLLGLPFGLMMLNRLPAVLTLYKH